MIDLPDEFRERAVEVLGDELVISCAPGRVEVLGNHTDYNGGIVLAATIDRFVWSAGVSDNEVSIESMNFQETTNFKPHNLHPNYGDHWDDYIKGVFWALARRRHKTGGLRAVIYGNVPIGSGLSSSAALEVSMTNLVAAIHGIRMPPKALAMIAFEAERLFCNVSCGVMDQFTSQLGKPNSLLAIQCASLKTKAVPIPSGAQFVIVNSMVSRKAKGILNERRKECQAALHTLQSSGWDISNLSAIRKRDRKAALDALEDHIQHRVLHVLDENDRVYEAIQSLETGNLIRFGQVMNRSHKSSKDLYEVSHPMLDLLVDLSVEIEGVLGSRMTGAGLGGSIISLVRSQDVKNYIDTIRERYEDETGISTIAYPVQIPGGVKVMRQEQGQRY